MPYIQKVERDELAAWLAKSAELPELSAGEMNYLITKLILEWIGEVRYYKLAEAMGLLECVKQELYRRVAAPYEDKKCSENGDVYPGA